eukprot:TRINITY_DN23925_c0_g1_i2.p1 TRINITY_DN23925_c0_g1~~TRINITY_DN23925_c0_g1_i2.p1  ORF type:complete len:604 (+),score=104.76 TRINITY_DN23925_c0_g1_i2:57-1814(+)
MPTPNGKKVSCDSSINTSRTTHREHHPYLHLDGGLYSKCQRCGYTCECDGHRLQTFMQGQLAFQKRVEDYLRMLHAQISSLDSSQFEETDLRKTFCADGCSDSSDGPMGEEAVPCRKDAECTRDTGDCEVEEGGEEDAAGSPPKENEEDKFTSNQHGDAKAGAKARPSMLGHVLDRSASRLTDGDTHSTYGRASASGLTLLHSAVTRGATKILAALIILDVALLCVRIDWLSTHTVEADWMLRGEVVLSCVFLLEMLTRMSWKQYYSRQGLAWKLFETGLVLHSGVYVGSLFMHQRKLSLWAVSALPLLRLFRMFRLVRVVYAIDSLAQLVNMVSDSIMTLVGAFLALLMLIGVFAVWITVLLWANLDIMEDDSQRLAAKTEFGTILRTSSILLQCVFGGVTWGKPLDILSDVSKPAVAVFLAYVISVHLVAINVFSAVVIERVIELSKSEVGAVVRNEQKATSKFFAEIMDMMAKIDADGDGIVDGSELKTLRHDKRMQAYLVALGLDVEELRHLFGTDHAHLLSCEDFVNACLKLRGSATRTDAAFISHSIKRVDRKMDKLDKMLEIKFSAGEPPAGTTERLD